MTFVHFILIHRAAAVCYACGGMSAPFIPSIGTEIFALRPDYCALSVVARGIDNTRKCVPSDPICAPADAAESHFEAWRAAYRAFGAKPQRTPCSAEALRKRLELDGRLPTVNPTVDLYNAISVRYAIPVGGEDIAAYQGVPRLILAAGTETFDTLKDGAAHTEVIPRGEVIWKDDRGATCRRWNWRQGVRTRVGDSTRDAWFVLERLDPLPIATLLEAGDALVTALRQLSPEASFAAILLDRSGRSGFDNKDRSAPAIRPL
jgi:DNA/RNA-binding domain of Phe-tRNA-synthetase-like protein